MPLQLTATVLHNILRNKQSQHNAGYPANRPQPGKHQWLKKTQNWQKMIEKNREMVTNVSRIIQNLTLKRRFRDLLHIKSAVLHWRNRASKFFNLSLCKRTALF